MARHHKPKAFWRLARIWFRHVRITVWLLTLLLLLSLVYLHHVGLPGFAQRAVLRAFEARGVRLDFVQLRLSLARGIVAEQVSLQTLGTGWVPRIEGRRVDLSFDPLEALKLRIVPDSLILTDGQLILPYPQTNGLPGQLTATNLQARIQFLPGVGLALESLRGEIAGFVFTASGTVANPNLIQDWRVLRRRESTNRSPAYPIWQQISQIRNDINFLTPPELRLGFQVDGAAPESLALSVVVKADAAASSLGLLDHPEVSVRLDPMDDGAQSEIELLVQADHIASDFGQGDHVTLHSTFSCLPETGILLAGRATLSAAQLDTVWAGATDLEASFGWSGDGTHWMPVRVESKMAATGLSTRFGQAEKVQAELRIAPFAGDHRRILDLPEFVFADLEPFELQASFQAGRVETPRLSVTNLSLATTWASPAVVVTNLSADLAGGHLAAGADFDATTGRLRFRLGSDFDPKRLYPVLPQAAVDWLDFFTYENAPVVNGVGAVTLPPWNRYTLLWPGDVQPSLYLNGHFEVGAGTYRRIPLSGASSHFTYSNMFWHLPNLTIRRPDGSLRLEHHNNDRTSEFIWKVEGAVDPTPALILLPDDATETRQVLDTLRFGSPPEVHLEFTGRWRDLQAARGWGTVNLGNVMFRGQFFEQVWTGVAFTNLTLTVHEPRVKTSQGEAGASSLVFDFSKHLAFLSNGVSTLPPMTIATAIGPAVIQAIEPYQFLNPPNARVEGVIPLKGVAGADLRIALQGGPFEWWNFHLREVEGRVHWREETVAVEILNAGFYEGSASGEGFFDFTGTKDADFRFNLLVEDTDMQPLVAGVFQSTNQIEGRLSGSLSVTNANTGDFDTWFGYGYAHLENGLLWSVPIFGIVSPVLDLLVPGLGSSRATEANGRYVITNSVIRTEDLVIRTSNMRLLYAGTVDFQGEVNAVAEAEILRDTFIVGGILSTALTPLSKAMIIEITGTLANPKARPLHLLPRLLLAPLNPVKLLKDVFAPPAPQFEDLPAAVTNNPHQRPPGKPAPP